MILFQWNKVGYTFLHNANFNLLYYFYKKCGGKKNGKDLLSGGL